MTPSIARHNPKTLVSNYSRDTLMSYEDYSAQSLIKSHTPIVRITDCYGTKRGAILYIYTQ